MTPRRLVVLLAFLLALPLSARPRPVAHPGAPFETPPPDVFSFAEPAEVRTTHLSLDLDVDFDTRTIRGASTHTIANLTGTRRFALDVKDLEIHRVTVDGALAGWDVVVGNAEGDALVVEIGERSRSVRIEYETRPSAEALHWLTALQTAGDDAPFLYTLSEPDLARSWMPVQDTPGIRVTWDAVVRVPHDLLALMSAPGNPVASSPGGVYTFSMPTSVPVYLVALAVGRVEFHPLGERTGFYAEPEAAADAAWDLQYLPEMFDVAEQLIGPYPWDRYDLLLLPPGFVAGGMENPLLNFVNVASVVSGNHDTPAIPNAVVAHELAHTWAGDLVTCATWSDTWLNEGFATYFEKRLLEVMMGDERAEMGFFTDRRAYESYMGQLPAASPVTTLHRTFRAGDPPAVFNATSYKKGGLFLKMLEDRLGLPSFDGFFRFYLEQNSERWADEHAFMKALRMTALAGRPDLERDLRLEEWIYGTGLPSNVTAPTSSRLWDRVAAEANAFRAGAPMASLRVSTWGPIEIAIFLQLTTDILQQRMAEVDTAFGMSSMKSASTYWWVAVAMTRYAPAIPSFERFMMSGSWSVVTVYDWLSRTPGGMTYARTLYQRAREQYVPEIQANVDRILRWEAINEALRNAA